MPFKEAATRSRQWTNVEISYVMISSQIDWHLAFLAYIQIGGEGGSGYGLVIMHKRYKLYASVKRQCIRRSAGRFIPNSPFDN